MKCAICKLEIRENQKIIQCPNCLAVFHEEHYKDWLERENTCPVCSIKTDTSEERTYENVDSFLETLDEKKMYSYKYFGKLVQEGLPKAKVIEFINNNDFFYHFEETNSEKFFLLKKSEYRPLSRKIPNFVIVVSAICLAFLIMPFISYDLIENKPLANCILTLNIIVTIITIYILIFGYVWLFRNRIGLWNIITFQNELLLIQCKSPIQSTLKTIPLTEIAEFELGKIITKKNRKTENNEEKMSIDFAVKTKAGERYSLGDIFAGQISKGQKCEEELSDFIKKNYKIPLISTDDLYQENRTKEVSNYSFSS